MKQYTVEELNSLQKEEVVTLMVQLQKQNDILTEQLAVMQADLSIAVSIHSHLKCKAFPHFSSFPRT